MWFDRFVLTCYMNPEIVVYVSVLHDSAFVLLYRHNTHMHSVITNYNIY